MQSYDRAIFVAAIMLCITACSEQGSQIKSKNLQIVYKVAAPKSNMVAYIYDIVDSSKLRTRNISVLQSEMFPKGKGNITSFLLDDNNIAQESLPQIKWKNDNTIEIEEFSKSLNAQYKNNVLGVSVIIK